MNKEKILNRLEMLRELVVQSESDMRLAIISYRKYQDDLSYIMAELDKIEDDIKTLKGRSIFDVWFGDPMRQIDEDFNSRVHKAIEDCNGTDD